MKSVVFLFLLFFVSAFAQEAIVDTTGYKCINYDDNKIENAETGLYPFFTALNKLEEGDLFKLDIYHLGDSHVAGLSFPNRLQYHFQINFGKLGRAVYNEPVPKKKKRTTRRKKRKGDSELIIDNIVSNSDFFKASDDTLFFDESFPIDTDTTLLAEIPFEKRGIFFSIYGNVGKTFGYIASSQSVALQLSKINPNLTVITLGTNDAFAPNFDSAEVAGNIKRLIDLVRTYNKNSSIIITTPAESYIKKKMQNINIQVVRNAIINVCKSENICYWDFYNIMGGENSMDEWVNLELAASDKIHFTKQGYALMADLLYVAIMKEYEKYLYKLN